MYGKTGAIKQAEKVFSSLKDTLDVGLWTAMLSPLYMQFMPICFDAYTQFTNLHSKNRKLKWVLRLSKTIGHY
jgi:hypothetical protein